MLVGVELAKPKGDCDGVFKGARLFSCAPNCGVFVKPTQARTRMPLPLLYVPSRAAPASPPTLVTLPACI